MNDECKAVWLSFITHNSSFITFLMTIRLLALDLDGTLLNSRGEISPRNREALDAARRAGVRVALVTGRRFRDARPLALELDSDVPLISHNGALTKHARSMETVAAHLLPLDAAQGVLRVGRLAGADAMVSCDVGDAGLLAYDRISPGNQALADYIAWSRRIVGDEAADSVRQVESLENYLDRPPIHIAYSGTCAAMIELSEKMTSELDDAVKCLSTLYPKRDFALLDILHPQASKGAGLAAVAANTDSNRRK
jgi:hydroxymethylpyrimidine pyrophosphatase-like HAD family hydrolase